MSQGNAGSHIVLSHTTTLLLMYVTEHEYDGQMHFNYAKYDSHLQHVVNPLFTSQWESIIGNDVCNTFKCFEQKK